MRSRKLATALAVAIVPSMITLVAAADGVSGKERGHELGVRAVRPSNETPNAASAACPDPEHMVLVEGSYCPEVRHTCKRWLEASGRYAYYRCAEYSGAECLSKERVPMRFCMDKDEWQEQGSSVAANNKSWTDAKKTCESTGKRLCLESEWNFACEGEEMRPYPYGWKRDADACNADRMDIFKANGMLEDRRVGADEKPRCVSAFGVHNLSGNMEEWTTIDATATSDHPRPAMKGAWWQPSRNHCRANQTAHDNFYHGMETGFRCCAEPNSSSDRATSAKTAAAK